MVERKANGKKSGSESGKEQESKREFISVREGSEEAEEGWEREVWGEKLKLNGDWGGEELWRD